MELEEVFEIGRCAKWVLDHDFRTTTLQFPDSLLAWAPTVATRLEKETSKRFAILGDTSYGECCVDEIAAEHLGSDSVIHFGHTCLTTTRRLPVLFIFTRRSLNVEHLRLQLEQLSSSEAGRRTHVFYDVQYDHALASSEFPSNISLWKPRSPSEELEDRIRCGRLCDSADDIAGDDLVLYCGSDKRFPLLLALTFPGQKHFQYNPEERQLNCNFENVSKALMKRFYLIEKAKDARRVGVLVGTLGVSRYRSVIDRIVRSVKESGKRCYTFVAGKPNVPKLANFPEIDVYVLVACPENSLIDAKEFMQPVITPYELDMALNKNRDWTGQFAANFQDILPGGRYYMDFVANSSTGSDMSLISGKVRHFQLSDEGETTTGALAAQETRISQIHQGGGGEYLANRSWQGLEQKLGQTEVRKAVQGRTGIAYGYKGEGEEENKDK